MADLPIIETERLILRPRTFTDLESCLAMDRDPDVTRYVPGPWSKPEEHRAFVLARMTESYPAGLGYWTVMHRGNPRGFLGWILLLPCAGTNPATEIGWRFTRDSWGRGYASEAATAVAGHALRTLGLERIVADIDRDNTASIRVAEKLGMQVIAEHDADGAVTRSYQITR